MNGGETLAATLAYNGVEVCFANPGTSEIHFLAALGNPHIRSVLCLFEGVATGAADGWYRMRGTPAATLLHLGPGLANGLANLHNARRASSGVVNIVGDHASTHLRFDAPLASDVEGLARPLSHWVRRATSSNSVATDTLAAIEQARSRPGRIATLILPGDCSWGHVTTSAPLVAEQTPPPPVPDEALIRHVAGILRSGEPTLMLLAGHATRGPSLEHAGRIAAKTGCRIGTQYFSARIERGAGRVPLERIPYDVGLALAFLKPFRHIVTVETGEPVAFFGYPDKPSRLKPAGCDVHALCAADEDSLTALAMLADELGAAAVSPPRQELTAREMPSGTLDPNSIAAAIAASLPENAILVDESITTGRRAHGVTAGARPHDAIQNMGGSIGFGTPVATGAAIACPDRRIVCMEGDGSAMYTIQSLWTQAREGLNVTTVVFANHAYAILRGEFANMGLGLPNPPAQAMTDLGRPRIDWVALGKSLGCTARRVETAEAFYAALCACHTEPGPSLIEVCL
jgi:acetolactate synthase-1/2/3 large subunit